MENNKINSNPWLGLKTYDEGQHLYGREDDIHALSQNILFNIQTVIYGKSGIGKSSILNAGIFPILRKSNFFPCYIRLVHNQPNKSYNQQIWDSVLNSLLHLKKEKLTADGTKEILSDIEGRYEELAPARDNESLWEIFHRHKFYDESNNVIQPVLVFDQFEEIFTREKDQEKVTSFFEELADLINNVVPETLCTISDVNMTNSATVDLDDDVDDLLDEGYEVAFADYLTELNFHIVLSLREDYLSYLERNIDNIPSLKHNRYCLKPLSEEQAASVIMHPCPGLISETVAKEIISKVTGSPVSEFELGDGAELEVDSAILSLFLHELYKKKPVDAKVIDHSIVNEFGDNIIQNFYEETISHISEDCAEYLERKLITEDGKRDSVYESHVINHKGYKASDLKYLKEQRLIREFPWNDGIRIEFIHDVLCPIIVQRKEDRKIAKKRLEEDRIREEERNKKEAQLIALKRKNRYIIAFILLLIISGVLYYLAKLYPVSERYASTIKYYGMFQGVERLTEEQASYRDYHFVLKKKGILTKTYSSMECRDKYNRLCTEHNMGTYLGNNDTSLLVSSLQLPKVCKWEFISDPVIDTKVIQERAYDENNTLIFAFNYNLPLVPIVTNEGHPKTQKQLKREKSIDRYDNVVIGTYVDAQGLPMQILKDGYRFVKISRDDLGHDMLVEYFDMDGNQATNADQAYQTLYEYDSMGNMISNFSLNRYGKRMIDVWGNCGMMYKYDGYRCVEVVSVNEYGFECPTKEGHSKVLYKYDNYGRLTQLSYWNYEKACINTTAGFHKAEVVFDDNQHSREVMLYSDYRDTILHDKLIYNVKTNKKGETISAYRVYINKADTIEKYVFKKEKNLKIHEYRGARNYINKEVYDKKGKIIEDIYFELDGVTPYEDERVYHKAYYYYDDNSKWYSDDSKWLKYTDSVVYYSRDNNIDIVRVNQFYPARREMIGVAYKYDSLRDSLMVSNKSKYILRIDGAKLEEYDLNTNRLKYRYIVNERESKIVEDAIGPLTRYGFPYPSTSYGDFSYYFSGTPVDENGDTRQQPLPLIYTDERNYNAAFIEYIDKIGIRRHAVLLESDAGVYFGEEAYDFNNFGPTDNVICLDLLTMKVKSLYLGDDDVYWSIYDFPITQLEYKIYERHYDNYRNENTISEKPMKSIVHGVVDGTDGYLPENGYKGPYVVLKWCDWDCSQSINRFAEEVENNSEKNKDIILLPYEMVNDSMLFLEPISISCPSGLLGLHITEETVSYLCYKEDILGVYNAMKEQ